MGYTTVGDSTMFTVSEDSELIVSDSKLIGSQLHYDGRIHDGNLRRWTQNRNIFETYGDLILNNVYANAGRAKSDYNPVDVEYQTHCIFGAAVRVGSRGYLEVNDATLAGCCNPRLPEMTCTVYVEGAGKVQFNNGAAYAHAGGDVFRASRRRPENFTICAGLFNTDYYSTLMLESYWDVVDIDRYGIVGVEAANISPRCEACYTNNGVPVESCSALRVTTPYGISDELHMRYMPTQNASAEMSPESVTRIMTNSTLVYLQDLEPYFTQKNAENPLRYYWEVCCDTGPVDSVEVANVTTDGPSLDLGQFDLELGKNYKLVVLVHETLTNAVNSPVILWTQEYPFVLTDSLEAPYYTNFDRQLVSFLPGESKSMTAAAIGENVHYEWQLNQNDGAGWGRAPYGTDSWIYRINSVTNDMLGWSYRCRAYNGSGEAYSREFILVKATDRAEIGPVGLPVAGRALDDNPPNTLTYGIQPTEVRWMHRYTDDGVICYEPLPDYFRAYPTNLYVFAAEVTMEYDASLFNKDTVEVYMMMADGAERKGVKVAADDETLTFRFGNFAAPSTLATPVELVNFTRTNRGRDPGAPFQIGDKLGGVSLDGDYYNDHGGTDARITYTWGTHKWYRDSVEVSQDTVIEAGHIYRLELLLEVNDPYYFAADQTQIYLDSRLMSWTRLGDGRIRAAVEYDTTAAGDSGAFQEYDLKLCSVQVNSINRSDVFLDGVFSYDPARNTLTVRGNAKSLDRDMPVIQSGISDLTIKMENDSFFYAEGTAIKVSESTVIQGNGSVLTIQANNLGIFMSGYTGTLTLRDADIWISGNCNYAVTANGTNEKLVIENCNLDAGSRKGGVCDFGAGITLTDTQIIVPQQGRVNETSIVNAGGQTAMTVQLRRTGPEPDPNPFVDVPKGKWYYDAVLWAYFHNPQITAGTDATHFSPNATCSRAQVMTFLWHASFDPELAGVNNPFTDVKTGKYYYKPVLWAYYHEPQITGGATETTFGINQNCTRAQVVTFLWKAAGAPEPTATENPFTDVKEGKYYYNAVLWAVEKGITSGSDASHFKPNDTCTRGQIVTFLYAAYVK